MAIEKFTDDLNIISALDDEPNDVGGLTAQELKAKFDEAGLTIQKYINETLLPGAENPDNITVGEDTLTNTLTAIQDAAETLREDYDAHAANLENPHSVTKAQVGLGSVDNTSDADKPVSTAQQAALDLKADKTAVILKGAGTEYTPEADGDPVNKKYADTKAGKTEVIRKGAGEEYTPTAATDPANKGYVDQTVAGATLGQIPDNSLTTEKYKDKSVTKEKLADDAVDAYTRAESLSDDTKTAFGLGTSAIPDNVLSMLSKSVLAQQGTSQGLEQGETGSTGVNVSQNAEMTAGNGVILIGSASTTSVHGSKDGGKTFQEFDRNHGNTSSLAFGNGSFVRLISNSTTEAYISTDGQSWSTVTLPVSASWSLVRYLNGYFYAFAPGYIARSQDGQDWELCAGSLAAAAVGAAYGGGVYVALSADGSFVYSSDGFNFTAGGTGLSSISSAGWADVAFGNGVFVAVTTSIAAQNAISTNGTTWKQLNFASFSERIIYENGLFVTVGGNFNVICSADGNAWTTVYNVSGTSFSDVCYLGDGTFYTITSNGATYYTFNSVTLFDRFTDVLGQPTGICHIETGSYIGTGLYGSSNPNMIAVSGTPVFFVVYMSIISAGGSSTGSLTSFSTRYVYSPVNQGKTITCPMSESDLEITFSEGTVQFYAQNGLDQLNKSGTTYNYLVFCI